MLITCNVYVEYCVRNNTVPVVTNGSDRWHETMNLLADDMEHSRFR